MNAAGWLDTVNSRVMASETGGGGSHTVEVVVFVLFAALFGSVLLLGVPGFGVSEIPRMYFDAIDKVREIFSPALHI